MDVHSTGVRHSARRPDRSAWRAASRVATERMESAQRERSACTTCAWCRNFDHEDDRYDPNTWCDAARRVSEADDDFNSLIPDCPEDGVYEGEAWEQELERIDQRARAMVGRTRGFVAIASMLSRLRLPRRPAMRARRARVHRAATAKASTGDPDPEASRLATRTNGGAS